jgi:alpha-beta hydrolase superfamily lysophospholipase
MIRKLDLTIDVTEAARLGEPAHVALSVCLPDPATLSAAPVVCFAKPGGGYSRGYYTADLPGPAKGAQADWHAARGWIFVAVDHLGVGGSSLHDGPKLDYTTVAAGNQAAEAEVLKRLAAGTLASGYPKVADPLKIGIGQSMGGCMTVIQQGRYHGYDGIGVLGYSAVHTHPPVRPGTPPIVAPWSPRDTLIDEPLVVLNRQALAQGVSRDAAGAGDGPHPMVWGFHYDDVDPQLALADLERFKGGPPPAKTDAPPPFPWASLTRPGAVAQTCLTPGAIAPEAAAVRVPVLVAMGERDVIGDPRGEVRAYLSANSVDFYVCPRMSHMHNFAGTRELFWRRIETWSEWVRETKAAG